MDYKYTMYNTTKVYGKTPDSFWMDPTPIRAQKRKDAWQREKELEYAELAHGSQGGRRRTKKSYTSRRRSRSSSK
jgi:hypothetical protein